MKRFFVQVTTVLVLIGCNESIPLRQVVDFGDQFEIALGEKVLVTDKSGSGPDTLSVEVISIEDDRCPTGQQCIRAGEIQVRVDVSKKGEVESLPMCLGYDCGIKNIEFANPEVRLENDTAEFLLVGTSYQLIFKEAIPHPTTEGKRSERVTSADRAILSVIR